MSRFKQLEQATDKKTDALQQTALAHTKALLEQAGRHFGRQFPDVTINFDLKGQAAGMVRFPALGKPQIRYNALLLNENADDFLKRTVPHEVAHVIARAYYSRNIRPHGTEWQSVMLFFGAEASRCHSYDTQRASTRKLQQFRYACGCSEHLLTSIRHKRIQAGLRYSCRKCKNPLELVVSADK
ncbi:MAG: SprT-like domain-containing protein [gamma proteobacterium endosymbiont of Lamellibrachia anaximandri]|nr:SprT-like domain-containing protein [gamma proteobacterium endosymbiont of Lamellibrachia anaximandri]MBL3533167.1 SprT-like domain-containing protein [gamma proteobacterium endosymbiont of Lamellibrachia anaximandri]